MARGILLPPRLSSGLDVRRGLHSRGAEVQGGGAAGLFGEPPRRRARELRSPRTLEARGQGSNCPDRSRRPGILREPGGRNRNRVVRCGVTERRRSPRPASSRAKLRSSYLISSRDLGARRASNPDPFEFERRFHESIQTRIFPRHGTSLARPWPRPAAPTRPGSNRRAR